MPGRDPGNCDTDHIANSAKVVANEFLEASVSIGYVRQSLPADRKDWYD